MQILHTLQVLGLIKYDYQLLDVILRSYQPILGQLV